MLKRIYLGFIMMLFWAKFFAQDASFYLPYQMPTHSSVKFNTFLANPSFPLLGFQEQNIGLHYRSQWLGLKNDNFTLMGLSYGINWNEINSANVFVYRRNAGIISNTGVVLNYGHYVQFSDQMGLRLGLNVIPMYSGVDQSRVIINTSDPLLNYNKSFGLTAQPGFDINFGDLSANSFHVGVTAENLVDYSFADSKAITAFSEKTFTGHVMYRSMFTGNNDILETGHWSVMLRATKEKDGVNLSANTFVDLPKLGWAYLGYTRNYGVFAGIGFNIRSMVSIGLEYENGLGAKIPQLGSTYGIHANFQFGGSRQTDSQNSLKRDREAREARLKRMQERIQANKVAKPAPKPVVRDTIPAPKPTPAPVPDVPSKLEPTIRVQNIASEKIPVGYYVIVGVFRDPRNAFRYIQELRKKYQVAGLVHPVTNFTYVYINGAALTREQAEEIHAKNMFNPDFNTGNIWILHVGNGSGK